MKRFLILGAALLFVLALPVFAHGSQQRSAASSSKAAKHTLTVWEYFSVKSQVKELKDLAKLFNKTNPNTKVNDVFVPYAHMTNKVVAAAAANSGPDVVLYNGPTIGQLVDAGALKNMTSDWNSFSGKNQFGSGVVGKVNGKVYGVQGYVNLLGLWYNKNILNKVGIKPPKTISQLTSDLKKVKKAGYTGITLTGKPNDQGEWQAYPWLSAFGWNYGNPKTATIQKAFSTIADWAKQGYLPQIAVTWGQAQPFQKFLTGKVAFAENGNWQIGSAKSKAKFKYGVEPMPSAGKKAKVYLGGEKESIGAFSKIPHIAWQYLKKTYFSKAGELIAVKDVGSIPARKDAASANVVTSDHLLAPFAHEVQNSGESYPPSVGSINKVRNAELAVAKQWSAIIAGQETPKAAAKKAVSEVNSAIGK